MKNNQTGRGGYQREISATERADLSIRQLENKYDLLQYKVDGWCIWPLLRFNVLLAMLKLPFAKMDRVGIGQLLPIAAKDLFSLILARKARHVAVVHASNRSEQEKGLYKDIFFDELLLEIGSHYKFEHIDNKIFIPNRRSALIKSDMTSTAFKIFVRLLNRLGGPTDIAQMANNLSTYLQAELGPGTLPYAYTKQTLLSFYWAKKLYKWLFARIQPEYLLIVTAYSDHAIVAAAKEQRIKTIEFQHGIVNRYHIGYSWSPYALPYKATMPIPDYLFLYGEYWKKELEINGFWQEELRAVGSPRMDQYRRQAVTQKGQICTLVLTTQGLDTERLITFLKDFLELAGEQWEFKLYIKLHPAERSKDMYQVAFGADERVSVLLSSELPSTFELLSHAHLHLSISSTCHYEALGLGIPTVILPFVTHEDMLSLYEAGCAFLARTPRDLLDIILQHEQWNMPPEISALYFKAGALENMKRELGL